MLKDKGKLFEKVLSNVLNNKELTVGKTVYDSACEKIEEISPDDFEIDSIERFDAKIKATLVKFEDVVKAFKESSLAKYDFLKSFEEWDQPCIETVGSLRVIGVEIGVKKVRCDEARTVGHIIGAAGGAFMLTLPFCPPLAVFGGLFYAGASAVQIGISVDEYCEIEKKLREAEKLIRKEKERYLAMRWFSCPEKVKNALDSLVDSHVFEQMAKRVEAFSKIIDTKTMTDDEFKNHYEDVVDYCMEQMAKESKLIEEYGKELAPAVMTFVFVVCLMNDHNRIALDSPLKALRSTLGARSLLNLGVNLIGNSIAILISNLLGVAINLVLAAISFMSARKPADNELTRKILEVADKIEDIHTYIKSVYDETKKYKSHNSVTEWEIISVSGAPDDAQNVDLQMAVKRYVPEAAWGRIRLLKLATTKEKNWLVMVPKNHSYKLLQQKCIYIKGTICEVK